MKILIVSKFFYSRGGAEVVAIATRQLLQERGHEVRVFAMEHPENIDIPDRAGFASSVDLNGTFADKAGGVMRVFGKGDVARAARKVLDDFRPDVVHLHNVHSYLSPVIGEMAHRMGARVVWTLHDYKLLCPAYSFRRPDGKICTECYDDRKALLRHRCMKGSMSSSMVAYMEARVWNKNRLCEFTDRFITPSSFMGKMMARGGFPKEKISTVCNFVDPAKLDLLKTVPVLERGKGFFCYIGRLSVEKGIGTLIKAALQSGIRLKLAGDGPLYEPLKKLYADNPAIEFLGRLDAVGVARLLNEADASVITSEWYENNPLGVIESLCAGTPVIGANIGGIPELLTDENGILYPSGDVQGLVKAFADFRMRQFNRWQIAAKAQNDFNRDTHYKKLIALYRP